MRFFLIITPLFAALALAAPIEDPPGPDIDKIDGGIQTTVMGLIGTDTRVSFLDITVFNVLILAIK
jgi:hypothetical protein